MGWKIPPAPTSLFIVIWYQKLELRLNSWARSSLPRQGSSWLKARPELDSSRLTPITIHDVRDSLGAGPYRSYLHILLRLHSVKVVANVHGWTAVVRLFNLLPQPNTPRLVCSCSCRIQTKYRSWMDKGPWNRRTSENKFSTLCT
jgi:hypothetical protein